MLPPSATSDTLCGFFGIFVPYLVITEICLDLPVCFSILLVHHSILQQNHAFCCLSFIP